MQFSFSLKYGRNQRRTAHFSIGIDLLDPDPRSSKNKAELKKLASCPFRKFVERPFAANFGRKTLTGNRKDANWSLTTFKGKISVLKFVMHFCYRRTVRLNQENISCNNNTNHIRRHKFISHKNNCCQVF